MNDRRRLRVLKRKAKRLYRKAHRDPYGGDADCGNSLMDFIRPERALVWQEFQKVWKEIKTLDPTAK